LIRRRLKVSSRDLRYILVFAALSTIVTSGVAYRVLSPPATEQFFAMWILGSGGLAEHYYPNDDPDLTIGSQVNWTLGVYNHMGGLQYVVLEVKLLNSTLKSPDEMTSSPSDAPPVFEFSRVLLDNETWTVPFLWKILQANQTAGSLTLTRISLNGNMLTGQLVEATSGYNFRFVFELWSYDEAANDLLFSWRTGSGQRSVWTQIWFNATTTR